MSRLSPGLRPDKDKKVKDQQFTTKYQDEDIPKTKAKTVTNTKATNKTRTRMRTGEDNDQDRHQVETRPLYVDTLLRKN